MDQNLSCIAIDDDPIFLRKMEAYLSEITWISLIETHSNPVKGATAVITHQPDLILLDIEMPHVDGVYLLDWLEPRWRGTQYPDIVIISSLDLTEVASIPNTIGILQKSDLNSSLDLNNKLKELIAR